MDRAMAAVAAAAPWRWGRLRDRRRHRRWSRGRFRGRFRFRDHLLLCRRSLLPTFATAVLVFFATVLRLTAFLGAAFFFAFLALAADPLFLAALVAFFFTAIA